MTPPGHRVGVAMRATCAILVALAACGRTPAPRAPSATVRAAIEQAEAAELERKHDVARAHYQRAVAAATDPASISFARREYADTLISWGEYPEAIAQLERALAAVEADPRSWHELGLLRHNQGDHAGAIAAFERSRALAPRDWRPRKALAILHVKLGNYAVATAEYRAMLELDLPDKLRAAVHEGLKILARMPATTAPGEVAKP